MDDGTRAPEHQSRERSLGPGRAEGAEGAEFILEPVHALRIRTGPLDFDSSVLFCYSSFFVYYLHYLHYISIRPWVGLVRSFKCAVILFQPGKVQLLICSESSLFGPQAIAIPGMFRRAHASLQLQRHSSGRSNSGSSSGCCSEVLCAFQLQTRSYHFFSSASTSSRSRLYSALSLPLTHREQINSQPQSHPSVSLPRRPLVRTCAARSFSNCSPSASSTARNTLKSRGQNLRYGRSSGLGFLTPTSAATSSSLSSIPHSTQSRPFSSTIPAMTATKIDGTAIAKKIRERLHAEIESTQKVNPRYKPSLKIIQGMSSTQNLQSYANQT